MTIDFSNGNTHQERTHNVNPIISLGKESLETQRSMVNRIFTFNDMGASEFQCGHLDTSENCFSQAASEIGIHPKSIAKGQSPQDRDFCEGDRSVNTSQCDEGMHIYNTPIKLPYRSPEQDTLHHITAAVVCFNMAQVKIKRQKISHAQHWLHQALYWTQANDRFSKKLTIKIFHCLGYCSFVSGKGDRGMAYYQQALSMGSQLNPGMKYLAASLNCIGVLHFITDNPSNIDKSLVSFEQSLQLYRSCADSANPLAVATVHNNIGRLYYLRSDFTKALQSYQEALEVRRLLLGEDSIDVAATLYNAAQAYQQLGYFKESLKYYKSFLCTAKLVFGEDSNDVALALKGVAQIHQERGNFESALDYFNRSLQALTVADGRYSLDVANLLNKIGNLCYEMKDYQSAMVAYTEGLQIEYSLLPPNHPHTIITQTNIGHIYKQMKEYQKALEAYQRVLNMQIQAFGSNALVLAETFSFIALMQYHIADYPSSIESYQHSLRLQRESSNNNNDHPSIASTLNSIGLVFFKQEAYFIADMCFTESLRIRTKLLGPDHGDVAIIWYNLATVYFERGEEDTALKMYKESLRIEILNFGEYHPNVCLTLRHLGQIHQQLGKLEEAAKYYQQALIAVERGRVEPDHIVVSKLLNLLGNLYLQLNKVPEMMACYVSASRLNEANGKNESERLVISGYNLYCLHKTNPPAAPAA